MIHLFPFDVVRVLPKKHHMLRLEVNIDCIPKRIMLHTGVADMFAILMQEIPARNWKHDTVSVPEYPNMRKGDVFVIRILNLDSKPQRFAGILHTVSMDHQGSIMP